MLTLSCSLFDYEKKTSYVFFVVAKDGGQKDIKNKTVQVRINLSDVNDNAPVFTEMAYHKNLSVNTPSNTLVVRVKANDRDSGINGEVRYSLSNSGTDLATYNTFRIDAVTGDLYTKQTLTASGVHMIQVVANDLGTPELNATGRSTQDKVWLITGNMGYWLMIRKIWRDYQSLFLSDM